MLTGSDVQARGQSAYFCTADVQEHAGLRGECIGPMNWQELSLVLVRARMSLFHGHYTSNSGEGKEGAVA